MKTEKNICQSLFSLKTEIINKRYKTQKPYSKTPSALDMPEKKEKTGSTPKKETKIWAEKNKTRAITKMFLKLALSRVEGSLSISQIQKKKTSITKARKR